MNVYVLVLILGIYAHMPWWFWVLFVILASNTFYCALEDK